MEWNGLKWYYWLNRNNKAFVFSAQFTFDKIWCLFTCPRTEEKKELQEQQQPAAWSQRDEAKESTVKWDIHLKHLAFLHHWCFIHWCAAVFMSRTQYACKVYTKWFKCDGKELKRLRLPFVAYPRKINLISFTVAGAALDICDGVKYPD